MHAPVALMLDFYSGWTFPRHLYSGEVYRVWGNLPYQAGDFLTDALLDLLYPRYQDSSYFHDESGFQGAHALWRHGRLPLERRAAVAAQPLRGAHHRRRTWRRPRDSRQLQAYAEAGGHLVITAGNLAKLPGGLAGRRAQRRT